MKRMKRKSKILSLVIVSAIVLSSVPCYNVNALTPIEDVGDSDEEDYDEPLDDDFLTDEDDTPEEDTEQELYDPLIDFESMLDDDGNSGYSVEQPLIINIKKSKSIKFVDGVSPKNNQIKFKIDSKYKNYFTVSKYGLVTAKKTMKYNVNNKRMNAACITVKYNDTISKVYVTCIPATNVKLSWKKKYVKFKFNINAPEYAVAPSTATLIAYYKSADTNSLVIGDRKDFTLSGDYDRTSLTPCGVSRIDSATGVETYYPNEQLATVQKVTKNKKKYYRFQTVSLPKDIYYDSNGNIVQNKSEAEYYKKDAYQVFKWNVDGAVTYFKLKVTGKVLY